MDGLPKDELQKAEKELQKLTDDHISEIDRIVNAKSASLWKSLGRNRRALRRKLDVDIDIDFLIKLWEAQDGKCVITGYQMVYPECTLFSVSIDRIDSDKGYTKDNVQLVCQGINFAKNKYTNTEILEFWNFRKGA